MHKQSIKHGTVCDTAAGITASVSLYVEQRTYTTFHKTSPFYYCHNSVSCKPIFGLAAGSRRLYNIFANVLFYV